MDKKFDVRVIVQLKDEFAKAVNKNGLGYTKSPELEPLKKALATQKATLTNVMRDFEYYVQSSDAHDAAPSPIIDWSRDATNNERAKAYYGSKFVITIGSGQKVFSAETGERIKRALAHLEGQGVVDQVRIDSMDPRRNPPIPRKYFQK